MPEATAGAERDPRHAVERVVLILANPDNEFAPYVYAIRLAGFLVIIAAIVDQNRKTGPF